MTGKHDAQCGLKRRGILAAAGAVMAGIMAKQAAQPVIAGTDGDVVLGATNVTTTPTTITNSSIGNGEALIVHSDGGVGGIGLIASGSSYGVFATGGGFAGVFGSTSNSLGTGVLGIANNGGTGVSGSCDAGTGVFGQSRSSVGVQGLIPNTSVAANTIAVYGNNLATGAGGVGVYGSCANGTGVYGQTSASNQYGILGTTYATSSTAIAGTCTGNGSSAFSGGTTNPNAFAAFFQGTVVVQGNFAVTGSKSAVVQHPRTGDHRLMYCVESPEAWFEDFGEGTLAGGHAEVKLDPDFAALVRTERYHVFLTGYDEHGEGLVVSERRADGFVVKERKGGVGNQAFSWRVVAKRADVKGERLGKFTMPNLPLPDPSKLKAPDLPTPAVPKQP